jgi:hypothetical protein
MNLNINIEDDLLTDFTASGKAELESVVQSKAIHIVEESMRLEESRRTSDTKEITASTIQDASTFISRFPNIVKTPNHVKWIQGVATISTLIAGGMFDLEELKNAGYLILFLIILMVAVGSTVYLIFNRK